MTTRVPSGFEILFYAAVFVAGGYGYLMNAAKIAALWDAPIAAELVIRVIATLFVPLGCILGYFP